MFNLNIFSPNSAKKIGKRLAALSMAGATVALMSGRADAAGPCIPVTGMFTINPVPPAECASPVGICGKGNFSGALRGDYFSLFSSIVPTADTPTTNVVLFTADATLHARLGGWTGDIVFKEGGAFHVAGDGEFSELFSVVGGTGAFTGASGHVYGSGTAVNGAGSGAYFGKVCLL
jgi:hypothetical protein